MCICVKREKRRWINTHALWRKTDLCNLSLCVIYNIFYANLCIACKTWFPPVTGVQVTVDIVRELSSVPVMCVPVDPCISLTHSKADSRALFWKTWCTMHCCHFLIVSWLMHTLTQGWELLLFKKKKTKTKKFNTSSMVWNKGRIVLNEMHLVQPFLTPTDQCLWATQSRSHSHRSSSLYLKTDLH